MNFLTNLIGENRQNKSQLADEDVLKHTLLLDHPDAAPEAKERSMLALIKEHAGLSQKEGQNLLTLASAGMLKPEHIIPSAKSQPEEAQNQVQGQGSSVESIPSPNSTILDYAHNPSQPLPRPAPDVDSAEPPMTMSRMIGDQQPATAKPYTWKQVMIDALAGGLSGGRTTQAQIAADAAERQNRLITEREAANRNAEHQLRLGEITAQQRGELERQTQFAGSERQAKSTEEKAMVEWKTQQAQEAIRNGMSEDAAYERYGLGNYRTPVPQASTIINGKDGAPLGIKRQGGQIITNPSSMLPDEKLLFQASQDAFKSDLDRDTQKQQSIQDRADAAEEGRNTRFNEAQKRISDQFADSLKGRVDYQVQTRIDNERQQYDHNPITVRFTKAAEASSFANQIDPHSKSPADSQGMIYAFAKAMDPESVVREGEYATVQKYSQSWLERFGFNARRIIDNSEFLTPEAIQMMQKTIKDRLAPSYRQYQVVRNSAVQRMKALQLDPSINVEQLLPDYAQEVQAQLGGDRTKPKAAITGAGGAQGGKIKVWTGVAGQPDGAIDAGQWEAFKTKYPGAVKRP